MQNLLKIPSNSIFSDSRDSKRLIFNFSLHEFTDDEKNDFREGLNFSGKCGSIEYSEFLLPFDLLFREIKREDLLNEDMSLIKTAKRITILMTKFLP